jgi:hypothetical protein
MNSAPPTLRRRLSHAMPMRDAKHPELSDEFIAVRCRLPRDIRDASDVSMSIQRFIR